MATARTTFVADPTFERDVLRSLWVRDLLEKLTEDGADRYRDGVPFDLGDLFESIFSDVALTAKGWRGRVGADDWKAALIELGTSRMDPDGSLRRAVESLGVRIQEDAGA